MLVIPHPLRFMHVFSVRCAFGIYMVTRWRKSIDPVTPITSMGREHAFICILAGVAKVFVSSKTSINTFFLQQKCGASQLVYAAVNNGVVSFVLVDNCGLNGFHTMGIWSQTKDPLSIRCHYIEYSFWWLSLISNICVRRRHTHKTIRL